jgi:hypothetical protein
VKEQDWLQLVLGLGCVAVAYLLWYAYQPDMHPLQGALVAMQHVGDAIGDWLYRVRKSLS